MKCRTATSRTAIGWSKSMTSRTSGCSRMTSGSRRSAWMASRAVAGEERIAVGDHDWVVVHVDHTDVRRDGLGDLVDIALGWQTGTDVEELPDAGLAS